MPHAPTRPPGRFSLPLVPAIFAALTLASAAAWTFVGCRNTSAGQLALIFKLVTSAWMPALYLFGAFGFGLAFVKRLAPTIASRTIALCVGLALMLTATHLLGWAGLLGGAKGPYVAWAVVVTGAALAFRPAAAWWEEAKVAPRPSMWWLVAVPACGLTLAAACSTPGWLWSSEFGGFDALSYHLQLPQEWLASGRVAPVAHNVYSFLPSYVEAAFVHCSLLSFPPLARTDADWGAGLVAREGQGLVAAQLLHAMLTVLAACALGRAVTRLTERALAGSAPVDDPRMAASTAGALAAGLFAWTPWSVVVGSLAYNEMAVLLMGAGVVMLLALDIAARARWCLAALFIGAACGAKLTAILFLGVPAAVALFAMTPPRSIAKPALLGMVVGLLMLAPWMARNTQHAKNPVFPFAASIFANDTGGTGHWNAEQVVRFASSHRFGGSLADRLKLSVLPARDPGNPRVVAHRGLMHAQWGWLFPFAGLAVLGLLPRWRSMSSSARGATQLLISAIAVQLLLWLFATHIQSRFLLPLLPCAAALVALCIGLVDAHAMRSGALVALVGVQAFFAYNTLAGQPPLGTPLSGVGQGAGALTGQPLAHVDSEGIRQAVINPNQWINLPQHTNETSRVLLLGDATPLYYCRGVGYATTWDTHPMVKVVEAAPGNYEAWSDALRAEGIEFVVINLAELERYERSGSLDPRLKRSEIDAWARAATQVQRGWASTSAPEAEPTLTVLIVKPLTAQERDALRAQREAALPDR
jgi:hypothetical protein